MPPSTPLGGSSAHRCICAAHARFCSRRVLSAGRSRSASHCSSFPHVAMAGGPEYIAGTSFFNPAVTGQPVHWAGGHVNYYVDQGPLSSFVKSAGHAMVDAAAALWSAVPTAGVTLTDRARSTKT
jgi:hypothetical protein